MRLSRVATVATLVFSSSGSARADDPLVEIVPNESGNIGAWMGSGPFPVSSSISEIPSGIDEHTVQGTRPRLVLASSDGALSLRKFLAPKGKGQIAYLSVRLRVAERGRYYGIFGSDDGLAVLLDGKSIHSRDVVRGFYENDDVVPLDLEPGEHALVVKLHAKESDSWAFHGRIVGDDFRRSGAISVLLPTQESKESVAAKLLSVKLDRGVSATALSPSISFRYLEGSVAGLKERAEISLRIGSETKQIDANAGIDSEAKLPTLEGATLEALEASPSSVKVTALGRTVAFPLAPRRRTHEALSRSTTAIAKSLTREDLGPNTLASISHLEDRLKRAAARGDNELDALTAEESELESLANELIAGKDPYADRTGPMRRAFVSRTDGERSEFGLYVPPGFRRKDPKTYPLIVVLHGLNGFPMAALQHFFGFDDESKGNDWEDRRMQKLPPLDAIVLTPSGRGNSMYRLFGEDDVLQAIEEVRKTYPIDATRITITGPSMGGIGTALLALRHPDLFAAAAPLCGYHSYFLRNDMQKRAIRPWERFLAEERSNVKWAENGRDIPMLIVHGTRDLPVANSGVFIDRYKELGYSVEHEHPDAGHNVWSLTYGNLKGAKWLLRAKRPIAPKHIRLKTALLRNGDDGWVHAQALVRGGSWGEVDAEATSSSELRVKSSNVTSLRFDRGEQSPLGDANVVVQIDGATLSFDKTETIALHREGAIWKKGPLSLPYLTRTANVSGPVREIFHHPVVFVYGTSEPKEARANEEVARAWAKMRYGVSVRYPIMSDVEYLAHGELSDRALFLVGSARTNRVTKKLEHSAFPFRVEGNTIVSRAGARFASREVGVIFTFPNPARPTRPIVVVEAPDAAGLYRSLSLPELLPDFMVYDERVAPSRGEQVLATGSVLAAGFYENDWSLPADTKDPLAP